MEVAAKHIGTIGAVALVLTLGSFGYRMADNKNSCEESYSDAVLATYDGPGAAAKRDAALREAASSKACRQLKADSTVVEAIAR
ncbi:MAG: hypothetical protein K0M64_04255 [Rhizobium sp.]|nr:hypothetical protein [Rhizobium sp.]